MLSYCFKCGRNTESIKNQNLLSSKKSKFIKEQEVKGLLSNLGLRTPLNKIPV